MQPVKRTIWGLIGVIAFLGCALTSEAASFKNLNGPALIEFGPTYTYAVTVEGKFRETGWSASGGDVVKEWWEGAQYFCQVRWVENKSGDQAKIKVWGKDEKGEMQDARLLVSLRNTRQLKEFSNIRNGGGKCLEVNAPDLNKDGGKVQIWECNTEPQQQWRFDDKGRLLNQGGKCLTAKEPKKDGGDIVIAGCSESPNQKWQLDDQSRLVFGAGKCLEVHADFLKKDGGRVQGLQCHNDINQKWKFE